MIDELENDRSISTTTGSIITPIQESESSYTSKISSLEQEQNLTTEQSNSKVVSECKSVTFAECPKLETCKRKRSVQFKVCVEQEKEQEAKVISSKTKKKYKTYIKNGCVLS